MDSFCISCNKKVEIKNQKNVKNKIGETIFSGICSVCSKEVWMIEHEALNQSYPNSIEAYTLAMEFDPN